MGDRAVVRFRAGDSVSPVVYLHWSGSDVPALLNTTAKIMKGRDGDPSYACARFTYVACDVNGGADYNLSVGVQNEFESHGDAGAFEIDVSRRPWRVKHWGGYKPRFENTTDLILVGGEEATND